MVYQDIDKVDVGVYDKVREYFIIDKKLGGLIKVFRTVHVDRLGRTVTIVIPNLDKHDEITINGFKFTPKEDTHEH